MRIDETLVGKLVVLGVPIAAYFFLFILYMAYLKTKPSPGIQDEMLNPKKNFQTLINFGIILLLSGVAAQAINTSYNITTTVVFVLNRIIIPYFSYQKTLILLR